MPKVQNGTYEIHYEVMAFYMGLFAQKMYELILTIGQFIELCRDIPQQPSSAYFIEIDRQKLGKLLNQGIDWLYIRI